MAADDEVFDPEELCTLGDFVNIVLDGWCACEEMFSHEGDEAEARRFRIGISLLKQTFRVKELCDLRPYEKQMRAFLKNRASVALLPSPNNRPAGF